MFFVFSELERLIPMRDLIYNIYPHQNLSTSFNYGWEREISADHEVRIHKS